LDSFLLDPKDPSLLESFHKFSLFCLMREASYLLLRHFTAVWISGKR